MNIYKNNAKCLVAQQKSLVYTFINNRYAVLDSPHIIRRKKQ